MCTYLFFHRVFDVNEKDKVDINELLKIKPENDTLKKMQHSKWATSNNLFDYNSFINDFYALIEEFNSYKDRTEPDKQSESQEVKLLDYYNLSKLYLSIGFCLKCCPCLMIIVHILFLSNTFSAVTGKFKHNFWRKNCARHTSKPHK